MTTVFPASLTQTWRNISPPRWARSEIHHEIRGSSGEAAWSATSTPPHPQSRSRRGCIYKHSNLSRHRCETRWSFLGRLFFLINHKMPNMLLLNYTSASYITCQRVFKQRLLYFLSNQPTNSDSSCIASVTPNKSFKHTNTSNSTDSSSHTTPTNPPTPQFAPATKQRFLFFIPRLPFYPKAL